MAGKVFRKRFEDTLGVHGDATPTPDVPIYHQQISQAAIESILRYDTEVSRLQPE